MFENFPKKALQYTQILHKGPQSPSAIPTKSKDIRKIKQIALRPTITDMDNV